MPFVWTGESTFWMLSISCWLSIPCKAKSFADSKQLPGTDNSFLASRDLNWITSSECFQQHIVCFMPDQVLKYVVNMCHGFC